MNNTESSHKFCKLYTQQINIQYIVFSNIQYFQYLLNPFMESGWMVYTMTVTLVALWTGHLHRYKDTNSHLLIFSVSQGLPDYIQTPEGN